MCTRDRFWFLGKEINQSKKLLTLLFFQFLFVLITVSFLFVAYLNVTKSGYTYIEDQCMQGGGLGIQIRGVLYSSVEKLSDMSFDYVYPECDMIYSVYLLEDGTEIEGTCYYFESNQGKFLTEFEKGCHVDTKDHVRVNSVLAKQMGIKEGSVLNLFSKKTNKITWELTVSEIINDLEEDPHIYVPFVTVNAAYEKAGKILKPTIYGVITDPKTYYKVRSELRKGGYLSYCYFDEVFSAMAGIRVFLMVMIILVCVFGLYSFLNLSDVFFESRREFIAKMAVNGISLRETLGTLALLLFFVLVLASCVGIPICNVFAQNTKSILSEYLRVDVEQGAFPEKYVGVIFVCLGGSLSVLFHVKRFRRKIDKLPLIEYVDVRQ